LSREDKEVEANGLVSLRIFCVQWLGVQLTSDIVCDSSSELWFQDGDKMEELHEIPAKVDEIVPDELVCLSVKTFGKIYINQDTCRWLLTLCNIVLNLGFQDNDPADNFDPNSSRETTEFVDDTVSSLSSALL
jgi:hypothetical protein